MQFIPARWLELAAANRPMSVFSYAIPDRRRVENEIASALLSLLPSDRRKLRNLS